MPTTWLLSATSYTSQVGLCAQEVNSFFLIAMTPEDSVHSDTFIFTYTILGEFLISLFKEGNRLPYIIVLSPFFPFPFLGYRTAAKGSKSVGAE